MAKKHVILLKTLFLVFGINFLFCIDIEFSFSREHQQKHNRISH